MDAQSVIELSVTDGSQTYRLSRADLDEYAGVAASMPDDSTGEEVFAACRAWMADKFPDLDNIVL